jgi:hypothetical protein
MFSKDITIYKFPIAPYKTAYDRDVKVSDYLSVGEIFDATKCIDKTVLYTDGLAFHKNIPELHQLIREELNSPLFVGSLHRSYEWEIKQGRSGDSKHIDALAIDLNGVGLVKLIETAVKEKNDLYHKIRGLGVNAFGFYDWGVHLDFRTNKSTGDIYFWDKRKKKTEKIAIWLLMFFFSMWLSGKTKKLFRRIKK